MYSFIPVEWIILHNKAFKWNIQRMNAEMPLLFYFMFLFNIM